MDMTNTTTRRHRRDVRAYLAFMLLFGLGLGYMVDTQGPTVVRMVTAHTCELSNEATLNPCVELDTSEVTDLRVGEN